MGTMPVAKAELLAQYIRSFFDFHCPVFCGLHISICNRMEPSKIKD